MTSDARPRVLLYMVEAGGGHRAATRALVAAAEQQSRPWTFEVVDLERVLSRLDPLRRLTGRPIDSVYNDLLQARRTRYLVPLLRVMHFFIRLLRTPLTRALADDMCRRRPALVVSVAPNFNACLRDAARRCDTRPPFLVLLTDYADFPPHFWLEPGIDGAIVGSDEAVAQARALGLPPERIHRHTGMPLHPRFYPPGGAEQRRHARNELGIGRDAFTTLLLFGGKGSAEMEPLARALLDLLPQSHVVALCGDNPPLLERLSALAPDSAGRLHPLGFSDRVPDYLAACDVLVTKPGPGSLAEAFHAGRPVVVTLGADTIPQERYNARLVEEQGVGVVVSHWREMPAAVARLAQDPDRLAALRARLAALPENRAVFEALDVVAAALPTG